MKIAWQAANEEPPREIKKGHRKRDRERKKRRKRGGTEGGRERERARESMLGTSRLQPSALRGSVQECDSSRPPGV